MFSKCLLGWLDFGLLGRFHFTRSPETAVANEEVGRVFYLDNDSASLAQGCDNLGLINVPLVMTPVAQSVPPGLSGVRSVPFPPLSGNPLPPLSPLPSRGKPPSGPLCMS